MAKIEVKQDEHIRDALRRFKKLCDHEGILSRSRRRNFYEKPSERRRREAIERMKNIRRAERIRLEVESHRIEIGAGERIPVTVSIGCAETDSDEADVRPAIQRADQALYQAKRTGRNRVVVYAPDGGAGSGA